MSQNLDENKKSETPFPQKKPQEQSLKVSEVFLIWLLKYPCSKNISEKIAFHLHSSLFQLICNISKYD